MPRKVKSSVELAEIRKRIRAVYADKKVDKQSSKTRSFGEELRRLIVRRKSKTLRIPNEIEIWLAFFDEVIAFWLLTWLLYRDRMFAAKSPAPSQIVCLMTLAGRVFQDLICVRENITAGFYIQSNVVARSLIEAIDVMHLLQLEPALADKFRSVQTNDEASLFWHKHCSRNKIHKRIYERWNWFFEGKETKIATNLHSQRDDYLDIIGMSTHPSFVASFVSFMDRPQGQKEANLAYQAMGSVSHMSKFTLHLIFLRVFEYGMLWVGPDANLYRGDSGAKLSRSKKKDISKSLSVVFSVVVATSNDGKPNSLFPEFKTYWARPAQQA